MGEPVYDPNDDKPVTRTDLSVGGKGGSKTLSPDALKGAETSPEGGQGGLGQRELNRLVDQVGKGFNASAAEMAWTKRAAGALWGTRKAKRRSIGSGIGGGVTVLIFAILGFSSGPLEFIHISEMLHDVHFSVRDDESNGRLGKLMRYATNGHRAERTRLGVLGNKYADRFEARMNESGLKSKYTETFGLSDGFTIDRENKNFKGLSDAEIKDKLINQYGLPENSIDLHNNSIKPEKITGYKQTLKMNRAVLRESGYGRINSAIGARILGKRAGVTWHPLKKADQALQRSVEEKIKSWKEQRQADVNEGHTEYQNTSDSSSEDDKDKASKDQASKDAGDAAGEIQEEAASGADNPDGAAQSEEKIKSKLGKTGAGLSALVAFVCILKGIDKDAAALKYAQIILPAMRFGVEAMSIGAQIQNSDAKGTSTPDAVADLLTGKFASFGSMSLAADDTPDITPGGRENGALNAKGDIDTDILGAIHDQMHGKDSEGNETSWNQAETVQAAEGHPNKGVKPSDTLTTILEHSPFHFLNDGGAIATIAGPLCSTAATIALTVVSFFGGPISALGSFAIGELANKFIVGPLISKAVRWIAGKPIDPLAAGADYGNIMMYGALLASNEQALSAGGGKLSASQEVALYQASQDANQNEFDQKSFAYRLLNPYDRNTLVSKAVDSGSGGVLRNTASALSNILGLKTVFSGKMFANFLHPQTAAAASATTVAGYDYKLPVYGFSIDDMSNSSVQNPYENAEKAADILKNHSDYIDRAKECFNVNITGDGSESNPYNVVSGDQLSGDDSSSPNPYTDSNYPSNCNEQNNDWLRVRFFIFDTITMSSTACYEGDEQACTDVDVNGDQTTANGGGGGQFRLATFNVKGSGHDSDGGSSCANPTSDCNYRNRAVLSTNVIKNNSFDVVGVQEMEENQYNLFKQNLPGYSTYPESYNGNGSQRTIFYNSSKFTKVSGGSIQFPTYGDNSLTQNVRGRTPWVKLRFDDTGQTIYVVNTHLVAWNKDPGSDGGGAEKREQGAKDIVDGMKSLVTDGSPIFLTGDMNSKGVLRPGSTFENNGDGALNGDRNRLPYCIFTAGGIVHLGSDLKANKTGACPDRTIGIDHVYASAENVTIDKYDNVPGPITKTGTDHAGGPVYADISIAGLTSSTKYKNPIIASTTPDPSLVRGDDGTYHLYATGGSASDPFQHYTSTDLVHWKKGGRVLKAGNVPGWLSNERWAPDIEKTGDHFTLTFSGGGYGDSCDSSHSRRIGYATAQTAAGPFTYRGELMTDSNCGYAIDPKLVYDGGDLTLYYGSGSSISAVKLNIDTSGKLTKNGSSKVVMDKGSDPTLVEGSWPVKHGAWYYLFYSAGSYKSKSGSDEYITKVARSQNPMGPFKDKHVVIKGKDPFRGPGHNAIITDDLGTDWIFYHSWYKGNRALMLDKINWLDGWPSVADSVPSSTEQQGPAVSGAQ